MPRNRSKIRKIVFSVQLPIQTIDKLDEVSEEQDISRNKLITDIINDSLDVEV